MYKYFKYWSNKEIKTPKQSVAIIRCKAKKKKKVRVIYKGGFYRLSSSAPTVRRKRERKRERERVRERERKSKRTMRRQRISRGYRPLRRACARSPSFARTNNGGHDGDTQRPARASYNRPEQSVTVLQSLKIRVRYTTFLQSHCRRRCCCVRAHTGKHDFPRSRRRRRRGRDHRELRNGARARKSLSTKLAVSLEPGAKSPRVCSTGFSLALCVSLSFSLSLWLFQWSASLQHANSNKSELIVRKVLREIRVSFLG